MKHTDPIENRNPIHQAIGCLRLRIRWPSIRAG
jgi:hypothetical protein